MHKYEFYSDWENYDKWWEAGNSIIDIIKVDDESLDNTKNINQPINEVKISTIDQIYKQKKEVALKIYMSRNNKKQYNLSKQKYKAK